MKYNYAFLTASQTANAKPLLLVCHFNFITLLLHRSTGRFSDSRIEIDIFTVKDLTDYLYQLSIIIQY